MIDLKAFAIEVMEAWPHGGIDGGDLQATAVKHGILIPTEMEEPCCENCECGALEEFPLTCYQIAEELNAKLDRSSKVDEYIERTSVLLDALECARKVQP